MAHHNKFEGLQQHSVGDLYPWTISGRGNNSLSPYNCLTGEWGPRYLYIEAGSIECPDGTLIDAHRQCETWIRQQSAESSRDAAFGELGEEPTPDYVDQDRGVYIETMEQLSQLSSQPAQPAHLPHVEYTFLIPTVRDSDRQEHDQKMWCALNTKLAKTFGGFAVDRSDRDGRWADHRGKLCFDTNRVYTVAIVDSTYGTEKLLSILRWAKDVFDQRCIYLARTSDHVSFV